MMGRYSSIPWDNYTDILNDDSLNITQKAAKIGCSYTAVKNHIIGRKNPAIRKDRLTVGVGDLLWVQNLFSAKHPTMVKILDIGRFNKNIMLQVMLADSADALESADSKSKFIFVDSPDILGYIAPMKLNYRTGGAKP